MGDSQTIVFILMGLLATRIVALAYLCLGKMEGGETANMDKKNPIPVTSWFAVIVIGAIVVNFITGIGDAMNELWVQLELCGRTNAVCFLLYDGGVILLLFAIALVIDFARRSGKSEEKSNRSPSTDKQENEPVLNLKNFGIEEKGWEDKTHTVNAFIEVRSLDVVFMGTYPIITWTNEQGMQLDENNGRWFYSNADMARMKDTELLSADLKPNGEPRKLYFSTNNKERKLYSWWRTPDDHNKSEPITDSPAYVKIFLKTSNGPTALYHFKITHSTDMLRLERLNNKGGVHGSSREFRYAEYLDKEKVKPSSEKTPQVTPAIIKRFSVYLEKTKKEWLSYGWRLTGISLGFLEKIKTAPPFLGYPHSKPIISDVDERELTEFFEASIYVEKYHNDIKGDKEYVVADGDDRNSIAKKFYGHEFLEFYIEPEDIKNFKVGTVVYLPLLNVARPEHSDDVKRKWDKSRDQESIINIAKKHNIPRDDAIPILRIIYDAAQKTIHKRSK